MSHLNGQLPIHLKTLIGGGILLVLISLVSFLSWSYLHEQALFVLIPFAVSILGLIQIESYYRSVDTVYAQDEKFQTIWHQQSYQQLRQNNDYHQIEALFSIFSLLRLRYPLPPMREWAVSPDFAKHLIAIIYERNPQLVVEISSGISTVIMGYCLQSLGNGQVIALEHDEGYAKISARSVQNHDLQGVAQVIHAPLKTFDIAAQTWQWYDTSFLEGLPDKIDLLVIDGPPGDLQPLSRYPALPLLIEALSDDCIVILDDGNREDEQKIVELWQQEFGFEVEQIPAEKGAFLLRRKPKIVESLLPVAE